MTRAFALPILLSVAACAANPPPVATFGDLPDRVNLGDAVTASGDGDERWRGHVVGMRPDELVLRVEGREVVLAADRVRRVAMCCDSLKDGPLIGLGIGAGLGALVFSGFSERRSGDTLLGALWIGGLGAAMGFGIDVLIGREADVYRASNTTVRVIVDPRGGGVRVMLRW
jgi:hypothetical protein